MAAPIGAAGYIHAMWQGVAGIFALCIALNLWDCAYRIHQVLMDRSPVSPGPGFSPKILRIIGLLIGSFLIISSVRNVIA